MLATKKYIIFFTLFINLALAKSGAPLKNCAEQIQTLGNSLSGYTGKVDYLNTVLKETSSQNAMLIYHTVSEDAFMKVRKYKYKMKDTDMKIKSSEFKAKNSIKLKGGEDISEVNGVIPIEINHGKSAKFFGTSTYSDLEKERDKILSILPANRIQKGDKYLVQDFNGVPTRDVDAKKLIDGKLVDFKYKVIDYDAAGAVKISAAEAKKYSKEKLMDLGNGEFIYFEKGNVPTARWVKDPKSDCLDGCQEYRVLPIVADVDPVGIYKVDKNGLPKRGKKVVENYTDGRGTRHTTNDERKFIEAARKNAQELGYSSPFINHGGSANLPDELALKYGENKYPLTAVMPNGQTVKIHDAKSHTVFMKETGIKPHKTWMESYKIKEIAKKAREEIKQIRKQRNKRLTKEERREIIQKYKREFHWDDRIKDAELCGRRRCGDSVYETSIYDENYEIITE